MAFPQPFFSESGMVFGRQPVNTWPSFFCIGGSVDSRSEVT